MMATNRLSGCAAQVTQPVTKDTGPKVASNPGPATVPGRFSVPASSNAYGLDLFRSLSASGPASGNLFLSPYSVSSAMVLVAKGSHGSTADQFAATFHFGSDLKTAGRAFRISTPG